MVYAKDADPENDMSIECSGIEEMDKYAKACREQGYKVVTKVKPETMIYRGGVDLDTGSIIIDELKIFKCPRCKCFMREKSADRDTCPVCKQAIEWGIDNG